MLTDLQWKEFSQEGWKGLLNVYAHYAHADGKHYQSPLSFALEHAPKWVMPLLKAGAPFEYNPQFPLPGHLSPLNLAVRTKHQDAIEWMIQHGVNLNHLTEQKFSIFHLMSGGDEFFDQWLPIFLEKGLNPHIPDPRSKESTPNVLHSAVFNIDNKAVHHILQAYPQMVDDINESGDTALISTCLQVWREDVFEVMQELISQGADLNIQNKDGDSALHATLYGFSSNIALKKTQILIEAGAHFDIQNHRGMTPLMLSVYEHPNIALYLLEKGADSYLQTPQGETFWSFCQLENKDLYQKAREWEALKDKEHLNKQLTGGLDISTHGRGMRL